MKLIQNLTIIFQLPKKKIIIFHISHIAEVCYRQNIVNRMLLAIGMVVKFIFRQKTNSIPFNHHHFHHFTFLSTHNELFYLYITRSHGLTD